jgi:hypothetical protein
VTLSVSFVLEIIESNLGGVFMKKKEDNLSIFKRTIWNIIRKVDIFGLVLSIHPKSYLLSTGWLRSYHAGIPIDRFGNPLPWLTYSFIQFISARLKSGMRVFEYGCGFSTRWFSTRVKEIISVDHDINWVESLKKIKLNNSVIIYKETPSSYASAIKDYGLFDIILIDGVERPLCFENACGSLNENGVIIWDNFELESLQTRDELTRLGFKVIDFPGLAPSSFTPTQTSIIYRANNCLGI